jgi:CheY-like chemotaxis protein
MPNPSEKTVAVAKSARRAAPPRAFPGCVGKNVKHGILVVEDNAINRELLCDWLHAHEYEVFAAEDLGGAQRLLQSDRPDAVLLDVQLGNEDGLSLAAGCASRRASQVSP